ncbi:Glucose-6-phosphate 1-dehydrogenase [compost metagenome]
MRWDQVEEAWDAIETIQQVWKNTPPSNFPNYKAGSWGPEEADELLARQGHKWVSNTQEIEKISTK